jgi:hypothetical protein
VIDTIKAVFTYVTALTIIVGGGAFLYQTYADPNAQTVGIIAIVSGFIGAAIQFVFGSEIQTRTAKQSEAASASGAQQATTPYPAATQNGTPLDPYSGGAQG